MTKTHKVLWTGGWDSTFRVLDLVFTKKRVVQPYYGVGTRRNTPLEISTMAKIIRMVGEKDPDAGRRLLLPMHFNVSEIPPNPGLSECFARIKSATWLGSQYHWLSRYAHFAGLKDLELCAHADGRIEEIVKNDVEEIMDGDDRYFRIKALPCSSQNKLFSCFHFPLLKHTKTDMERLAKESGFGDIMEETWFCHFPINGRPCGLCRPCRYAKEEGMGRRVPAPTLGNRVRFKSARVAARIQNWVRRCAGVVDDR